MRLIDADEFEKRIKPYDTNDRMDGAMYSFAHNTMICTSTVKAIPVKWIVDWLTKQHIPATHTCDDYYAVEMMLDDWEKENG